MATPRAATAVCCLARLLAPAPWHLPPEKGAPGGSGAGTGAGGQLAQALPGTARR